MSLALRGIGRAAHQAAKSFALPAFALATTLALGACGGGGGDGPTTPPPPPPPAVAVVELSATSIELAPSATSQLTATARSAAGAAITDRAAAWSSASTTVATVSAAGLVTGVSDGTTSVSVTIDGRSASAAVTVRTPVASVAVTPGTASTVVGGTPVQLSAAVLSAAGAPLAGRAITWSSSNSTIATVSQSGVVTGVGAGATTILATSEGRTGTALVTVTAPDPCASVRPITVGQTFSGALASGDCRLSDQSALQTFSFTLTAATALEIEMTSSSLDSYLYVLDANKQVVAEDDDGGAGSNARVLRSFAAGVYYVVANSYDPNTFGPFQLTVRPAPAACVTSRPITLPGTVNASLTATNSCRLNDDSYFDRYDVTVSARTTVRFDMTSTVIDPYLVVYDGAGKLVSQDDDAGTGTNARIEVRLEPGRYTVLANALPSQLGVYRLDVAVAVDPCAVNRTIAIGQSVTSALAATDCAVGSQGPMPYTQRWALSVPTARPLQIDMTSPLVDSYLVIQDAVTGAVLAENDDVSTTSVNARIAANFPAGEYIVNTTSYDLGETGTFNLSVAAIVTATPVSITVLPNGLALASGQQQQLSATVTGTSNTAVSWESSSSAVAVVSSTGLVRGVTPGSAFIFARSGADPSKFVSVPVTVTQSQTGTPNLDIGGMYLIQSVQQLDGSVPLVANRDAVARVFLRGSRTGIGSTTVRLRFYQGTTLLQTLQTSLSPALSVDETCCSADIVIPGALIKTGVSVVADADPANLIVESNENDNSFPVSGVATPLNVVAVSDFNLRLVPVRQNRAGTTGVATSTVTSTLRSLWPLSTVNITTRQPLAIDYALVSTSFDEWSQLVRDLELTRRAESSDMYYYGLVRVTYSSGVLGLAGGIPALSAVGLDEASSFGALESRVTLAHEMGHTMGLRHAPCGGAAGPDPAYPFSDARTGAFGMDIAGGNVIKIPTGTDIMSYCENQWVSVYNYRNVLSLRARSPNGVPAGMIGSTPASVLMVTGAVGTSSATIDGAFAITAAPSRADASGRWVVEGFSATGDVVFSHRFTPFAVSDSRPGDEAFVVGVPLGASTIANVARVAVREVGGARTSSRTKSARPGTDIGAALRITGAGSAMRLEWPSTTAPMVLVRDPRTGTVLGIGRTGALDLSQFRTSGDNGAVEVLVSDGVSSARRSVNTITGAIRQ